MKTVSFFLIHEFSRDDTCMIYAPRGGAAIRNRMLSAKLTRIAHQVSQERDLKKKIDWRVEQCRKQLFY